MRHKPEPTAASAPVVAAPVDGRTNDSIPHSNTQHQGGGSRLERLPAELRLHVLSLLDLDCLKALVRASPTFHQQYLNDRRRLLCASLQVTLRSVSLDACIVGAQYLFSATMKYWRDELPHRSSFQLPEPSVTEDEAVAMARFHVDVVAPVARHFMNETLSTLRRMDRSAGSQSDSEPKPSDTEWRRCLRAAYRFEILFYAAKSYPTFTTSEVFAMVRDIFHSPEPWEGEELLTFYEFAARAFQDASRVIDRWISSSSSTNPEQQVLDFTHLAPSAVRDYYQHRRTLPDGLELLRAVLIDPKPQDREILLSSMRRSLLKSFMSIRIIRLILCCERQRLMRWERDDAPTLRDELTNQRAPLPFQGDNLHLPPLAWADIWDGTYSDLIGGFIPPDIRRWGYVFWDADRMNRNSRRHLLRSQWTDRWDRDPRDTLDQDTDYEEPEDEEPQHEEMEDEETEYEDTEYEETEDDEDSEDEETEDEDTEEQETEDEETEEQETEEE